jgi:hypothetical protein
MNSITRIYRAYRLHRDLGRWSRRDAFAVAWQWRKPEVDQLTMFTSTPR